MRLAASLRILLLPAIAAIVGVGIVCIGRSASAAPAEDFMCVDSYQAADQVSTCCGDGAKNCDGVDSNGCECRPHSTTCETVDCIPGCTRTMKLNDSACPDAPLGCSAAGGSGLCRAGYCSCVLPNGGVWTPPDMAGKADGGHGMGGCSFSAVPASASALALLLVALIAVALRRRRS